MTTSKRLWKPVNRAGEFVRETPKRGLAAIVILGLLVAVGIWGWPELHRTIRMHRM
jgi:hypothetical protein